MMESLRLSELIDRLDARLVGADLAFERLSTDTRNAQPGDLFLALKGERFDAHDFLDSAVNRGVCALVVEREFPSIELPQLVVADTQAALGQIAAANRERFTGPLAAITGSSGKTTVKTLLAGILVRSGPVLATRGNYNNHIGVPLTLLELDPSHDFAVIEMGASGPGEIASYCRWAQPDLALINNVMPAHIEGFGSVEGVAKAKGEIYSGLKPEGTAIINLDEVYADQWLALLGKQRVLSFSLTQVEADCRAENIALHADSVDFTLITPLGSAQVHLGVPGEHNIRNALAAATCAVALEVSPDAIARGLETFEPIAGRMSARRGYAGALVIDDSYNANPGSVRAAIEVLAAQEGQRILVLGDMGELGERASELHRELGERARDRGIERLITLGPLSGYAARAFGEGAREYDNHDAVIAALKTAMNDKTRVLIKGSRSAGMDTVVRGLIETGEQT